MSHSAVHIRRATPEDSPSISRICLLTGDAGVSAESLHTFGELIGVMYAEPYVHLPSGFGFVMVDPTNADGEEEGDEEVVGYVVATHDTRAFERELEEEWLPHWREKYHYPLPDVADESAPDLTEADIRYIKNIHNPSLASQAAVEFSPAHMHINILPAYQRQGWGRRLIGSVVEYIRNGDNVGGKGLDGLWLGMDVRNVSARTFYERLGFRPIQGAPDGVMGLKLEEWKS